MRLPRHLLIHPANAPLAVRAAELSDGNSASSEELWRCHQAHLNALYARLYPDNQEPFAVLPRIRARRGLKQTLQEAILGVLLGGPLIFAKLSKALPRAILRVFLTGIASSHYHRPNEVNSLR
jgi:hypothetical protein